VLIPVINIHEHHHSQAIPSLKNFPNCQIQLFLYPKRLFILPLKMLFLPTLATLVSLAAALPAPNEPSAPLEAVKAVPSTVKVKGVSLLGTGCPAGTADVQVDATGTLFEATFSAYEVQTGPGTMAADWRKNCKLTINMEFSEGFQ
jgi:hypothetical protein